MRKETQSCFFAARETVRGTVESLEALHRLLASCKEVDKRNNYGETPLLYTVSTQTLKHHGALLDELSTRSYVKTWRVLVDAGAQIDARNHESESILHLFLERMKYLLHDPLTSQEQTLIRYAVEETIRMVKFVCEKDKKLLNSRNKEGDTALHNLACYASTIHGDEMVQIAEVLIECGSLVNAQNDYRQTPLHLVKLRSMTQLLLRHGGDANACDSQGHSPLLCRCLQASNNEEPLDLGAWFEDGLNHGMDPWLEDKEGQNVFEILLQNGKLNALHSLIISSIYKDKETIFKKDQKGNTLLHILCNHNAAELRQLLYILLQEGADVNALNEDGDTPMHIVCRKIVKLPRRKDDNSAY